MNIDVLIDTKIQEFINKNLNINIEEFILKKNIFNDINNVDIAKQIESKNIAKEKLPIWFNTKNIVYPKKLNLAQSTSQKVAEYKSTLFNGTTCADITGGFGVDTYFLSKSFNKVFYFEIDIELATIAKHNFKVLEAENIIAFAKNGSESLDEVNDNLQMIYIDPSRRNKSKGKVFLLEDCQPNLIEKLPYYFKYANKVVAKLSPMIDLQTITNTLPYCKQIWLIALHNELKEVLVEMQKNHKLQSIITAVNIEESTNQTHTFTNNQIKIKANYSLPKKYLYEPNVALLKSGRFEEIATSFSVNKLNVNTHLYTSDVLRDFHGRRFLIQQVIPFKKQFVKEHLYNKQINVSIRNFPLKPEEIKSKYKIKDGGSVYAFFITNMLNEKIVLLCQKI